MTQDSGSVRPRKTAAASAVEKLDGAKVSPQQKEKQKRTRQKATVPPAVQELGSLRPIQAAEFLGVGLTTLWPLALRPDFPKRIKIGPRMTVWKVQDLIAWRDAQPREKGAR
jgi:predicted DNA-binding transcriptional regulator AlpA